MDPYDADLCKRVAQVRGEFAGPRGKAGFAKQLGISPSTYDYYESTRAAPCRILVKIAEIAGVDLVWLLTGKGAKGQPVPATHPAVQRIAALLEDKPGAAASLTAFLDILSDSFKFPPKGPHAAPPSQAADTSLTGGTDDPARKTWIPILGRSAAGVPQFWKTGEEAAGVTRLDQLIERHSGAPTQQVLPARIQGEQIGGERNVQIITLTAPHQGDVPEFVAADQLKARHGDAFATRIDGDSMAPDICHGDLVILSPSAQAVDGEPAVVQLSNQIGVTCKLYRRQGQTVHLVPINEKYFPQSFPAEKVVWALRVVAHIRPQQHEGPFGGSRAVNDIM